MCALGMQQCLILTIVDRYMCSNRNATDYLETVFSPDASPFVALTLTYTFVTLKVSSLIQDLASRGFDHGTDNNCDLHRVFQSFLRALSYATSATVVSNAEVTETLRSPLNESAQMVIGVLRDGIYNAEDWEAMYDNLTSIVAVREDGAENVCRSFNYFALFCECQLEAKSDGKLDAKLDACQLFIVLKETSPRTLTLTSPLILLSHEYCRLLSNSKQKQIAQLAIGSSCRDI